MLTVYGIPNCTTCKKAREKLAQLNIDYQWVNLKEQTPSIDTLKWILESEGENSRKLFNTSGERYRELQLKNRFSELTIDEKAELLADNGILIKRPLFVDDNRYAIRELPTWLVEEK